MLTYPDPSESDQADFVRRLYFGSGHDVLGQCLKRAYLDFSRTVHGIAQCRSAYPAATSFLRSELSQLPLQRQIFSSEQFDKWHKTTCRNLLSIYSGHAYPAFSIGQAQKWINMALKYIYVFGEERLPGFKPLYSLCHIPIDNIIIKNLSFKNPPKLKCAWSRITSYDDYMLFQHWVRQTFQGSSPLAVEFRLWQATPIAA